MHPREHVCHFLVQYICCCASPLMRASSWALDPPSPLLACCMPCVCIPERSCIFTWAASTCRCICVVRLHDGLKPSRWLQWRALPAPLQSWFTSPQGALCCSPPGSPSRAQACRELLIFVFCAWGLCIGGWCWLAAAVSPGTHRPLLLFWFRQARPLAELSAA